MITVLVVDDMAMCRRLLVAVLERDGRFEVVAEANDGYEAVRLYREYRPDIVTLDLVMPDFSGVDTYRELCQIDPEVRAVIVSGGQDRELVQDVLDLGVVHTVNKPVDPNQLVTTMLAVMRSSPTEAANEEADTPLRRRLRARQKQAAEPAVDPHAPRILLGVLDKMAAAVIAGCIRAEGHQVIGQTAEPSALLHAVRDQRPDLVFLSCSLPEPGGLWCLEQFRQVDPALRVIMIADFGQVAAVTEAVRLGAAGFLVAPLEVARVRDEMQRVLSTVVEEAVPAPVDASLQRRVLIVEDQALMRALLRKVASLSGLEVVAESETASAGVELFEQTQPDVVLLDIQLPDGNGLDVLAEIQRIRPGTTVVMTTGASERDIVARAAALGAAGYILKPFEPLRAANRVRQVLGMTPLEAV